LPMPRLAPVTTAIKLRSVTIEFYTCRLDP
jgi:hypothetical protein